MSRLPRATALGLGVSLAVGAHANAAATVTRIDESARGSGSISNSRVPHRAACTGATGHGYALNVWISGTDSTAVSFQRATRRNKATSACFEFRRSDVDAC